jgi:hypothetical protein
MASGIRDVATHSFCCRGSGGLVRNPHWLSCGGAVVEIRILKLGWWILKVDTWMVDLETWLVYLEAWMVCFLRSWGILRLRGLGLLGGARGHLVRGLAPRQAQGTTKLSGRRPESKVKNKSDENRSWGHQSVDFLWDRLVFWLSSAVGRTFQPLRAAPSGGANAANSRLWCGCTGHKGAQNSQGKPMAPSSRSSDQVGSDI